MTDILTLNNEVVVTINNIGCFKGRIVNVTDDTFSLDQNTTVLASHIPDLEKQDFTFNKKEIYLLRYVC
ncbi:hypothetical protein [Chengkuizengella sediminis]|uniref:hypothetical protein n=1 Tax=Chengkuizengella sediminis TaxID=1885917 RepID=UPI001389D44F|nr:hypothetical protein [Chengkuizengella sediminis]NDI37243.1 hypothetical protein [Chengkuizengella sediminis]